MAAASTDKFKKGARKWVGQIGAGGVADASVTTIPLSSATGLPTDTGVVAVIDRVDSAGAKTPSLEETIIGVVSGSNLVTATRGAEGTAQAHSAGAVVEILITNQGWNDVIDGILVGHAQDGTHKSGLALTLPQINDTSSDHQYIVAVNELAADRTVTLPLLTGNDEFVFKDHAQTLANKTLTSPKVGTAIADTSGNELMKVTATASAVNEITLANAATGGNPKIEATGDDTNIGINLATKGTGKLQFGGVSLTNVLQVSVSNSLGETTATNQDTVTYCGQLAFTPKSAASTIYVIATASGVDNGGGGRMRLATVYGTTGGDTSGTGTISSGTVAQDSTATNGLSSITLMGSFAPASTTTQYIKLLNTKQDSSTAWYVGRYSSDSKIIAVEVLA